MKILTAAAAPQSAPHAAPKRSFCKAAAAPQSRTSWWVDIQEHRDGLTSKELCGRFLWWTVETGQDGSRPRLKQKMRTTNPDSRKVESDQDGLMSYGICHTLPPVVQLSSWIHLITCHAIPATACVYLIPSCFFSCVRCTAHCHQQCVCANLANRARHTSFNRLSFRGVMTPSLTPVRPGRQWLLDGLL